MRSRRLFACLKAVRARLAVSIPQPVHSPSGGVKYLPSVVQATGTGHHVDCVYTWFVFLPPPLRSPYTRTLTSPTHFQFMYTGILCPDTMNIIACRKEDWIKRPLHIKELFLSQRSYSLVSPNILMHLSMSCPTINGGAI